MNFENNETSHCYSVFTYSDCYRIELFSFLSTHTVADYMKLVTDFFPLMDLFTFYNSSSPVFHDCIFILYCPRY